MSKEQQLKNFVAIATGRARVRASKPPTREEQVVNRMVTFARAKWNNMSPQQKRAMILRGCT
jgi:hypothetical protein